MLFNSLVFLIFAACFFAIWAFVKRHLVARSVFIVAASFIFYGWWDWRFLFLIIASGLVDFLCALGIQRFQKLRKMFLMLSLFCNIGSLALFKYLDFFIGNVNSVSAAFSSPLNIPAAELILPVGISFYTFQSMSYTIDVYKGEMKPTRNLEHFFAYLSMFPQLVAPGDAWVGLQWIVHGYFKKMVIADSFAPIVAKAFESGNVPPSAFYWWCVVIMFAFQIYCDFSGYSDIARGLGKWMGFTFPENFNHPYIAVGFRDFWSRWHISLSTWFRDYVYVPLGGSRVSAFRAHANMWATMLISGLWHGAAWTFVVWGALHAMYLSVERSTKWPARLSRFGVVGTASGIMLTFVLTCIAWVFFRADSLGHAGRILTQMVTLSEINVNLGLRKIGVLQFGCLAVAALREAYFAFGLESWSLFNRPWFEHVRVAALGLMIPVSIFFRGPGASFVYFQF